MRGNLGDTDLLAAVATSLAAGNASEIAKLNAMRDPGSSLRLSSLLRS